VNAQELISSGILEMYVLGAASSEEQALVEQLAKTHPEVKAALEQCQGDVEGYVSAFAKEPPAAMFTRIAAAVEKETPVIPIQPAKTGGPARPVARYAMAASLLLFIISAAFNVFLGMRSSENAKALAATRDALDRQRDSAKNAIAEINTKAQTEIDARIAAQRNALDKLASLHNPATITMKPVKADLPASTNAQVYWCSQTHVVCIDPMNLPAVPEGKQYQLWAIVGGKPVSAGVFDSGSGAELQMLQVVPQAEAFAVTLEKAGGVPAPEGAMYVMAKI
jgi:anti-sigma-K factor RskA